MSKENESPEDSGEDENPEDFAEDENGIPKNPMLWLTKMYGAHPLLAPGLRAQGKLSWPTDFAIRWRKYKEQKIK